jgi:hypothetical protein
MAMARLFYHRSVSLFQRYSQTSKCSETN